MSAEIRYEAELLLRSLAAGIVLMTVYDGLRLFRLFVRHGTVWTGIEDLCYWMLSGMTTFLLLLKQNDGVLRGYAVGGVLAGMFFYNALVSKIEFRLLKKMIKYFTIKRTKQKRTKQKRTK